MMNAETIFSSAIASIDARQTQETLARTLTDNKRDTFDAMRAMLNDVRQLHVLTLAQFDASALTDASRKMQNVYNYDKLINLVEYLSERTFKINEMSRVVVLTLFNAYNTENVANNHDVKHACSAHYRNVKSFVVQRNTNCSDSTANAQHASSLNALRLLGIVSFGKQIAKDVYEVTLHVESELTQALAKRLDVTLRNDSDQLEMSV